MKKQKIKAFIRIANIVLCVTYALSVAYGDLIFIQQFPLIVQVIPFLISIAIEILLDGRISK